MEMLPFLLAFCGGVFGSFVGGTIAFIFSGLLALIGLFVMYSTGNSFVLDNIAFGPFFGPEAAFVGGVAAAAWLGKHSEIAGNNVVSPLFNKLPVRGYLIGGTFGVFGYAISILVKSNPWFPIDSVAIAVVLGALITRFTITKSGIDIRTYDEKNFIPECLSQLRLRWLWGASISVGTAYICMQIGAPSFGWAISALTLLFNYSGKADIPATHHITMVAGYAAIASHNLFIALFSGLIALLLGIMMEVATQSDTPSHIDMPATVISFLSVPIFMWG